MKLDYIKERLTNKQELVPTVLLGVSVLCGILILIKVTSFFVASARAESLVKRAIKQSERDPKNLEKELASSTAISDDLKKNNLFALPPVKKHPVTDVSGIFGDQVLIMDKWYGVGDMIKDAKIVAIGPTSVTIAWNGTEKVFLPIQSKIIETASSSRSRTATASKDEDQTEEEQKQENREESPEPVTVRAGRSGPPSGGRRGPGEGFMAMRQRFENMSEDERQDFRDRMRERFARERGGRRRPGGR